MALEIDNKVIRHLLRHCSVWQIYRKSITEYITLHCVQCSLIVEQIDDITMWVLAQRARMCGLIAWRNISMFDSTIYPPMSQLRKKSIPFEIDNKATRHLFHHYSGDCIHGYARASQNLPPLSLCSLVVEQVDVITMWVLIQRAQIYGPVAWRNLSMSDRTIHSSELQLENWYVLHSLNFISSRIAW